LFVDRVLRLARGEEIIAVCAVSAQDEYFALHFPAKPVMPASLLLEAFAQAGTILLEVGSSFSRKAFPAFIENAKFRRLVIPGSEMRIEMRVAVGGEESSLLAGRILQAGALCATASMGFATAPLGESFAPTHRDLYRRLYQAWLAGAEFLGFSTPPLEELHRALA